MSAEKELLDEIEVSKVIHYLKKITHHYASNVEFINLNLKSKYLLIHSFINNNLSLIILLL